MPATAKMAMFFRQIVAVFLVRTRPASSMAKPAAIHITRKPPTRNEKVLKMKAVSAETSARAGVLASATAARARLRSEEHTSELQSLMRISYAVFCLQKTNYHA